jgi:hypothetical protein
MWGVVLSFRCHQSSRRVSCTLKAVFADESISDGDVNGCGDDDDGGGGDVDDNEEEEEEEEEEYESLKYDAEGSDEDLGSGGLAVIAQASPLTTLVDTFGGFTVASPNTLSIRRGFCIYPRP